MSCSISSSSQPAGSRVSPSASDTILLVEDDPDIRAVLAECLEYSGYCVIEAADAEAAIVLLERGLSVPLMVTDINLGPGASGIALSDRVRHDLPEAKVVFITGRMDMLRERGLKDGEFLMPKPFPLVSLIDMVGRFAKT